MPFPQHLLEHSYNPALIKSNDPPPPPLDSLTLLKNYNKKCRFKINPLKHRREIQENAYIHDTLDLTL